MRGLLDAGAERVQTELAGQPELQAEMLTVMGRIYRRLGASTTRRSRCSSRRSPAARRRSVPSTCASPQTLNDLGVGADRQG